MVNSHVLRCQHIDELGGTASYHKHAGKPTITLKLAGSKSSLCSFCEECYGSLLLGARVLIRVWARHPIRVAVLATSEGRPFPEIHTNMRDEHDGTFEITDHLRRIPKPARRP